MKIVLSVGRFEKQKAYDANLKTCKELSKIRNDFEVWWVGEGKLKKKFEKKAKGLPIKFLGQRNDVKSLMKQADVIFHPSYYEGCSNVLIEAMKLRKTIVCRDIPENNEFFSSCALFASIPADFTYTIHCILSGLLIPEFSYPKQKIFKLKNMISSYEQLYKRTAPNF